MSAFHFKRIGLLCKDSEKSRAIAAEIVEYLDAKAAAGVIPQYFIEPGAAARLSPKSKPHSFSAHSPQAVDCIILAGGDGAFLQAEADFPGIPKLAVNSGNVGFLSELGEDFRKGFDRFFAGDFHVAEVSKLCVHSGRRSYEALNDAYAYGVKPFRPVNFRISSSFFNEVFFANGIIFSTPTGSTGHAFSAGGPLVSPALECMLMKPVAPLNPLLRSVVFPPSEKIIVEPLERKAAFSVDGIFSEPFERLEISASKNKARLVQLGGEGVMARLRRKLLY